jgi:uncharacterized membrane protein YgdD (TMEM256/DUF423 family)
VHRVFGSGILILFTKQILMRRKFGFYGCILASLAVLLGAFGAHSVKPLVQPEQFEIYQTAAHYHICHSLAVLLIAASYRSIPFAITRLSAYFFVTGIFLFSGSLYLLGTSDITGVSSKGLIAILTPLGGLCLLAAWILLALAFLRKKTNHKR